MSNRELGELNGDTGFDKKSAYIIVSALGITSIPGLLIYLGLW